MNNVNHPNHYNQLPIECLDAIYALGLGEDFCLANAFKYLWRCKSKNGVEDIKKAHWYLGEYLKKQEEETSLALPKPGSESPHKNQLEGLER